MKEKIDLRALLIKATKDKELREKFLSNPEKVAEEHGVSLSTKQIEKLHNAALFIGSLDVIRWPQPPPEYPLDPIVSQWCVDEIVQFARESFLIPDPIYYPPSPMLRYRQRFWRR